MARSRREKGWTERVVAQVPAKIDGVTLEQIPANLWRDGVRTIDPEVFNRILTLAAEHGPERGGVSAKAANRRSEFAQRPYGGHRAAGRAYGRGFSRTFARGRPLKRRSLRWSLTFRG